MSLRRKSRRFTLDCLEPRTMLDAASASVAAMISAPIVDVTQKAPVGVNVSRFPYYGSINPFVDVTKSFTEWGQVATPWITDDTIPRTADGYPLTTAATFADAAVLPHGVYKLSWAGNGNVVPISFATCKFVFVTAPSRGADGRMRGEVLLQGNGAATAFGLKLTDIDPSNPIRDVKMIRPGFDENTTQVYTDEYLRLVRPFQTLRFVDWIRWETTQTHWANRATPESFAWSGRKGVPYEAMIDLANEVRSDIWLTVPVDADDDYVINLARMLKDRLSPGLHAYIEYSNETWNGTGPTYKRHLANAKANPALTQTLEGGLVAQQAAFQVHRLIDLFRGVYGEQFSQVIRPVLAAQAGNDWIGKLSLQYYAQTFGPPAADGISLAIAPYFSTDGPTAANPNATVDQLLTSMEAQLRTATLAQIRGNATWAKMYNIPMSTYEGGQHVNSMGINQANKSAMQNDPRMGRLYDEFARLWASNGGSMAVYYSLTGWDSASGAWGLLPDVSKPGSAKWDAVMRQTLPAGDATLDGRVTFDDFLVLKSNYGWAGRAWSQGDFNGDGLVNNLDVSMLMSKLDITTLSSAQSADVLTFNRSAASWTASGTISGSVVPSPGSSTDLILASILASDEYLAKHGGTATGFISGLYSDLLGRDADASGLAAFSGMLASGKSRYEATTALMGSMEAALVKVARWYAADLGRTAPLESLKNDPGVINLAQLLQRGGVTDTQGRACILGSAEYRARSGGTDDSFVASLYRNLLHRDADAVGLIHALGLLRVGALNPERMAYLYLVSAEGRTAQVAQWYALSLHRGGSIGELKQDAGVIAWSAYFG